MPVLPLDAPAQTARRAIWPAMLRGAACRCPNCGRGALFAGFLKVAASCSHCGEAFFHHRADDFPPYVTMVIVGHVVVFAMLELEMTLAPEPMVMMAIFVPMALLLGVAFLRPVKGAIVSLQWALRMHGFGGDED